MLIQSGEKKLICIGVHASCQSKVSPGPQAPHFESHPEAVALLTVLQFFLGHEVAKDPTVPWVEATLRETALMEPLARTEQLERRAWAELRAVLVASQGRRNHGLG